MATVEKEKNIYTFTGIKVEQPLGAFFIGKIPGGKLSEMSQTEVRDMKNNDINQRIGIQRELNANRVKEICEYVKTADACFPNSVILSVKEKYIKDVKDLGNEVFEICLMTEEDTFQIIDGQHRIAGLEGYTEKKPFDVNVSLFLDMDIEQQAILFATINSKQKGVNKSLMMDLHTMQSARNPIKSAHYIGRILNERQDGALLGRISPFYTSPKNGGYKYTQANFIARTIKYISGNDIQLIKDRDALKKGQPLVYANEQVAKKLIFRNLFIDEQEGTIALLINNYFCAVRNCWFNPWEKEGYVLARTIGFNALMAVMPVVVGKIGIYDDVIPTQNFEEVFKNLGLVDEDFEEKKFNLSGYGQSDIVHMFKERL
ncbi:MAG: DGQHR domain-containing protein [Lachnospiraceae bacterium]|nr:DGQHR domain-containing protein [Lachnospiraceae bacterium]